MRRPRPFRATSSLATLVLASVAAACRGGTEPRDEVVTRIQVGVLASPASAALRVPDSVDAGVAFPATVVTQGNGCLTAAGAEARVAGLVATLTPYDMLYDGTCPDILLAAPRTVLVRFDQPGIGTVRAVGANGTTAERTVVVRPLR